MLTAPLPEQNTPAGGWPRGCRRGGSPPSNPGLGGMIGFGTSGSSNHASGRSARSVGKASSRSSGGRAQNSRSERSMSSRTGTATTSTPVVHARRTGQPRDLLGLGIHRSPPVRASSDDANVPGPRRVRRCGPQQDDGTSEPGASNRRNSEAGMARPSPVGTSSPNTMPGDAAGRVEHRPAAHARADRRRESHHRPRLVDLGTGDVVDDARRR